jgi:hypothetical protein
MDTPLQAMDTWGPGLEARMKWLAIATAIGPLMACGGGSANIEGSYDVTITASTACSANLPSATRELNYVANVAQTGAVVQVTLLADVIWNTVTVSGMVSGQTVRFSNFAFSEITTGGGVRLVATGIAIIAADGSITGILSGTFQTPSGTHCNAANHQFQMVAR